MYFGRSVLLFLGRIGRGDTDNPDLIGVYCWLIYTQLIHWMIGPFRSGETFWLFKSADLFISDVIYMPAASM